MKVVITPNPQQSLDSELLEFSDILVELKENKLINKNISLNDFKFICLHRGLNDYRKDLRLFDC
mgnify:FL=1|tara:strand:+ start:3265 stop:3456 length:192 start_codon:yes stop_codon:yes gene_type:complete